MENHFLFASILGFAIAFITLYFPPVTSIENLIPSFVSIIMGASCLGLYRNKHEKKRR